MEKLKKFRGGGYKQRNKKIKKGLFVGAPCIKKNAVKFRKIFKNNLLTKCNTFQQYYHKNLVRGRELEKKRSNRMQIFTLKWDIQAFK